MRLIQKIFLLIILFAFATAEGQSPNMPLINVQTKVFISGTSNLHNWHMNAENPQCQLAFFRPDTGNPVVGKVFFKFQATDLKSESTIMDRKAYKALKAKKYPVIRFVSENRTPLTVKNAHFSGIKTGSLSIAGITHTVNLRIVGESLRADTISFSGSLAIKMSSFGISPPTAIFGVLKTGDKIVIHYQVKFVSKKPVR